MSSSTGSSPTISKSVPHSSQDTISPLSVSISTWTSASHSGQVPVGTVSSSHAILKNKAVGHLYPGGEPLPLYDSRNNLTVTAGICNTLFLATVLHRSFALNVLLGRVFWTKPIKQLSYGLRIAKL